MMHSLVDSSKSIGTKVPPTKFKALPVTALQSTSIFSWRQVSHIKIKITDPVIPSLYFQLVKVLNAMPLDPKHKSVVYTIEPKFYTATNRTVHSQMTSVETKTDLFRKSKIKMKYIDHYRRNNPKLSILTSDDHKIRQFSLNQTHGMIIYCNKIRRRQLRDLIYQVTTAAINYSLKVQNSSSNISHYDILSSIIFIISFLFLQNRSD